MLLQDFISILQTKTLSWKLE